MQPTQEHVLSTMENFEASKQEEDTHEYAMPLQGRLPSIPSLLASSEERIDFPFANSEMHFCHSINRNCASALSPSPSSHDRPWRDEDEGDRRTTTMSRVSEFVLLIKDSGFSFKSCIYLRCIKCHQVDMMLDAPKRNKASGGKFGTLS